jgi:carbonic anhydrase/acetyltransferase-like protein (isoleucine patch superfamily)
VVGEVLIFDSASIWYGAVLRGDKSKIKIGSRTNVQDRAVINTVSNLESGYPADVDIGDHVTIGHGALLTSCTVGDRVLIGQGSIIQEGCEIQSDTIIAAGAVVAPGTVVASGQMWAGNPAKFMRNCSEAEMSGFEKSSGVYEDLALQHAAEFLPFGTVYQHAEKIGK